MKTDKLWGGRFTKKTHPLVEEFTKSIRFDQKLAFCDCWGSIFHIDILKEAKLITAQEHQKLHSGLEKIIKSINDKTFNVDESFEDIHSYIRFLLEKNVGDVALKLHTCRSRNDQVVLDMKLYSQLQIKGLLAMLEMLMQSLQLLANKNKDLHMPGYTHLQHAIPVKVADYLLAYVEMFKDDCHRFNYISKNMNLTMGSGALAGTLIESKLYNRATKRIAPDLGSLGDIEPATNSIYSVSDRDFVVEILSATAIIGMHLSRLSEDLILWATKEFDFINIDESFCTGSSLMPQKKNPDVLELIRGYSGRLYGNLMNVLVIMKGLPLSYNRDMQHDKEPLFDSLEITQNAGIMMANTLKHISFKKENLLKQLTDEDLYATDLADYLVENGVAFKEAHSIIGKLIHSKHALNKLIVKMENSELKEFHPLLNQQVVKKIIDPKFSVDSKKSIRRKK